MSRVGAARGAGLNQLKVGCVRFEEKALDNLGHRPPGVDGCSVVTRQLHRAHLDRAARHYPGNANVFSVVGKFVHAFTFTEKPVRYSSVNPPVRPP